MGCTEYLRDWSGVLVHVRVVIGLSDGGPYCGDDVGLRVEGDVICGERRYYRRQDLLR